MRLAVRSLAVPGASRALPGRGAAGQCAVCSVQTRPPMGKDRSARPAPEAGRRGRGDR